MYQDDITESIACIMQINPRLRYIMSVQCTESMQLSNKVGKGLQWSLLPMGCTEHHFDSAHCRKVRLDLFEAMLPPIMGTVLLQLPLAGALHALCSLNAEVKGSM